MINKLGIGTVQFGMDYGISNKNGITSQEEVENILNYANEVGIDLIDTAFGYGASETVIGNVGVTEFHVVTKFLSATSEYTISDQVRLSLERLKINHLYGLLAHRPKDLLEKPEIWEYLESLKVSKTVDKIGFSFNEPKEIDQILGKGYFPDIIQVPYNYLDNRFESYMVDLKNNGCIIHTRSTFLQGLFFMNPEELDNFFNEIKPELKVLQKYGKALPGLLLKYCLQRPFIDKVIIGVNNRKQLFGNINAVKNAGDLTRNQVNISSDILTPSKWPKT